MFVLQTIQLRLIVDGKKQEGLQRKKTDFIKKKKNKKNPSKH